MMAVLALVASASGAGAVVRYIIERWARHLKIRGVPLAITVVNVSGSAVAGLVVGAAISTGTRWSFVAFAFLSAYTTFSSAMVECVRVADSSRVRAIMLAVVPLVIAVASVWLGAFVTQLIA